MLAHFYQYQYLYQRLKKQLYLMKWLNRTHLFLREQLAKLQLYLTYLQSLY